MVYTYVTSMGNSKPHVEYVTIIIDTCLYKIVSSSKFFYSLLHILSSSLSSSLHLSPPISACLALLTPSVSLLSLYISPHPLHYLSLHLHHSFFLSHCFSLITNSYYTSVHLSIWYVYTVIYCIR